MVVPLGDKVYRLQTVDGALRADRSGTNCHPEMCACVRVCVRARACVWGGCERVCVVMRWEVTLPRIKGIFNLVPPSIETRPRGAIKTFGGAGAVFRGCAFRVPRGLV